MVLVSACLAGYPCRYDGRDNAREDIIALVKAGEALPVCPECLGGLSTPRSPCERQRDGSVINREGEDKSEAFLRGAQLCLQLCRLYGINKAILKAKSPSCGVGYIYDGSFSGRLVQGNGLCAELLEKAGMEVIRRD